MGAALPDDMNAQHWNAAKYAFSKSKLGVSATYSPWLAGLGLGLQDIYMAYLSGHLKLSSLDAISLSLTYFSLGEMDITDYDGNPIIEDVKPHEFALDAAYSRKLTDNFSMAVTGRFIYSNLTTVSNVSTNTTDLKPGLAGAADVALFYQTELKTNNLYKSLIGAGLTISNIGNKISYSTDMEKDFLPANFRLGVAYTMYVDKFNKLTFEFDVNKLLVPSTVIYKTDTVNAPVLFMDISKPVRSAYYLNGVKLFHSRISDGPASESNVRITFEKGAVNVDGEPVVMKRGQPQKFKGSVEYPQKEATLNGRWIWENQGNNEGVDFGPEEDESVAESPEENRQGVRLSPWVGLSAALAPFSDKNYKGTVIFKMKN